jgi:hypothetical protein
VLVAEFELPDGSTVTIGQSMESGKAAETVDVAKRPRKRAQSMEAEAEIEAGKENAQSASEAATNPDGVDEPKAATL